MEGTDLRRHPGKVAHLAFPGKLFSIDTKLPRSAFNWSDVYGWDPDAVKRDPATMTRIFNSFVCSTLTQADKDVVLNPLALRLLQVLQSVMEYVGNSLVEFQRLHGQETRKATHFQTELGRLRGKTRQTAPPWRCPTCSAVFETDMDLDAHFAHDHPVLSEGWFSIRRNELSATEQQVASLQRQLATLRELVDSKDAQPVVIQFPVDEQKHEPAASLLPEIYPFEPGKLLRSLETRPEPSLERFQSAALSIAPIPPPVPHKTGRLARDFVEKSKHPPTDPLRFRIEQQGLLVKAREKRVGQVRRRKRRAPPPPEEIQGPPSALRNMFEHMSEPFYAAGSASNSDDDRY
jgi:hypothetical protein